LCNLRALLPHPSPVVEWSIQDIGGKLHGKTFCSLVGVRLGESGKVRPKAFFFPWMTVLLSSFWAGLAASGEGVVSDNCVVTKVRTPGRIEIGANNYVGSVATIRAPASAQSPCFQHKNPTLSDKEMSDTLAETDNCVGSVATIRAPASAQSPCFQHKNPTLSDIEAFDSQATAPPKPPISRPTRNHVDMAKVNQLPVPLGT
jgi:hypothetical protein